MTCSLYSYNTVVVGEGVELDSLRNQAWVVLHGLSRALIKACVAPILRINLTRGCGGVSLA